MTITLFKFYSTLAVLSGDAILKSEQCMAVLNRDFWVSFPSVHCFVAQFLGVPKTQKMCWSFKDWGRFRLFENG